MTHNASIGASGLSPAQPRQLDGLRQQVMEHLSALLESQTHTHIFGATIRSMIGNAHSNLLAELERISARAAETDGAAAINDAMEYCGRLEQSLDFLFSERKRQWHKNGKYIQQVLKEFGQTMDYLASTLVERDLFERQSQVLEQIILSHERVLQWKAFIQEILSAFHSIFPFNFFFIAFAEGHSMGIFIYYYGGYSEEIKYAVRERLSSEMLRQLHLPQDIPLDIEEYQLQEGDGHISLDEIGMITVSVPEHAPKPAGLLGVTYASVYRLSPQEQSIIRSLLSVMVMVVGSSKVLSRTLEELEYYSGHDPLTGLFNRRRFTEILEYEVGRAQRHHRQFCILLLDLDNFKDINDSYGHPAGDKTLVRIGEYLHTQLRKGDVAARIGGDEFVVILPETPVAGARKMAETLCNRLCGIPFDAPDGKQFYLTTSIGLVNYPGDGQNITDLMAGVDLALYHAKGLGKNEVSSLEAVEQQVQVNRDSRIYAEELRRALNQGQIVPYFQPIIDCLTEEVFANEAVARLLKPDCHTVVAAGSFIETIEKYGLGRDLDKAILTGSLTAMRNHMRETGFAARLFINLSAQEIQERGILQFAETLCNQFSLPPGSVVFEIMERDALGDTTHMRKFLANLREKGFAFALDGFGSGYNSFHCLRELHFEYVKIDGAFVRNILNSPVDRALVSNLSRLCQDLGILTVAEFVESREILTALQEMGINYAQGFSIGMPTPRISQQPYSFES